jgi:hypothetical protein
MVAGMINLILRRTSAVKSGCAAIAFQSTDKEFTSEDFSEGGLGELILNEAIGVTDIFKSVF